MTDRLPFKYIFLSTGRSGTKFISHLITRLGSACGHESLNAPDHPQIFSTFAGTSGYEGIYYLDRIDVEATAVVHLIRDPFPVIASYLADGFPHREGDVLCKAVPPLPDESSLHWCVRFYLECNQQIESLGMVLRLRLEDTVDPEVVKALLFYISVSIPDDLSVILDEVPRNINTRIGRHERPGPSPDHSRLGWPDIPEDLRGDLRAMAQRYGYLKEEA